MNLFFWLLLNLGVPILGPFFILALFAVTRGRVVARHLMVESIRNGQLFWSAISLSASAVYESMISLAHRKGAVSLLELGVVMFSLIALSSSIIVTLATLDAYNERMAVDSTNLHKRIIPGASEMPMESAMTVKISIILTAAAAFLFTLLHGFLSW
jgi:hypothetical protein